MSAVQEECTLCHRRMTIDNLQPISIPDCGHTCCTECLHTFIAKSGLKCPVCSSGNTTLKYIGVRVGAVAGGCALIAAAPVALTAIGFTSAGATGGSWAAWMMSLAATNAFFKLILPISALQSAGAAGIGGATTCVLGVVGGGAGGKATNAILKPSTDKKRRIKRNK